VIGAGPAGYVAAIRCAQLGLKTVCIDEWLDHSGKPSLGGTCLNVGCIPSKALLESSYLYQQANKDLTAHGIETGKLSVDIATMQSRKDKVVNDLTRGINTLFKENGVASIHGHASIVDATTIKISERKTHKKLDIIKVENIIIASGSSPVRLPQAKLKDGYIIDSAAALELSEVPERVGVIGAGAIGLELGSVWSRLGSEVVIMEAMKDFLPAVDRDISNMTIRSLKKQQLDIRLNARLLSAKVKSKKVRVSYEDGSAKADGSVVDEVFDKLIIAVGRKPNSDRLFEEGLGIEVDERSFIMVDKNCETSVPNIYAIGDVIGGQMLAHKGSEEGMKVAEHIAGHHMEVSYECIPSVIYTHPELAWAGKTEQACKVAGIEVRTGRFPFVASGRARAMGDAEGMVKIVSDAKTDEVLGVHIFSSQASELIAQAVLMMEMQATSEDMALTIFAHPTLSEALHEAALSVHDRAIHVKN
jgi:dihydrolipoamide dehydrogenase